MPVEKCSDGAARGSSGMFIHGLMAFGEQHAGKTSRPVRPQGPTWSRVVARVMTSNSGLVLRLELLSAPCPSLRRDVIEGERHRDLV